MLEKSGTILLTKEDLEEYKQGCVSDRLQEAWGMTLAELQFIVENNNYKEIE